MTDQDKLELHKELVDACGRLLGGRPPEVQATVLSEMLAIYLGGWPETLRESLLENILKNMRELIPMVEVNTLKGVPTEH